MRCLMNTFSMLFFIKRIKLLNNGEAPIYLRITTNSLRGEMALYRTILPELWNAAKGKAKGNSREIRELNSYLDEYISRIVQCKRQLENDYMPVTPET